MSPPQIDHATLLVIILLCFTITVGVIMAGFAYMHAALREGQRMTKALAGLVIQETGKLRTK